MTKDLWEAVPIDVDPKEERMSRRVPVVWRWEDFEISRFTEFDRLKVKKSGECIGRHFMDLNSAKQYVYRFLETGGFPDAETNFKTLCNMTSFDGEKVYNCMKNFKIKIPKCSCENENFYVYISGNKFSVRCENIYEAAGWLQEDFLTYSGMAE
jgi:hypothetical protein